MKQTDEARNIAQTLGMGFYRVNQNGTFIECNPTARRWFNIPYTADDLEMYTIQDLYVLKDERKKRIEELTHTTAPLKGVLTLYIAGQEMWFFDVCWPDEPTENENGYFAIIHKLNNFIFLPETKHGFPVGFFLVDDMERIVRCNLTMAKLAGYEDPISLIGKQLHDVFIFDKERDTFMKDLSKNGYAHALLSAVNKRESREIFLEVCSHQLKVLKKKIEYRWGLVSDVTERERYIRAINESPTAYYYIESSENGHELINFCNKAFSEMFGFKNSNDAIGIEVMKLHANADEYHKFIVELMRRHRLGQPIKRYVQQAKRVDNGNLFWIEVDAHYIDDPIKHQPFAREGTIRDITSEMELRNKLEVSQKQLEKTTADINRLIHTFKFPVMKFYGNVALLYEVSRTFFNSDGLDLKPTDPQQRGKILLDLLDEAIQCLDARYQHTTLLDDLKSKSTIIYNTIRSEKDFKILTDKIFHETLFLFKTLSVFSSQVPEVTSFTCLTKLEHYLRETMQSYIIKTADLLAAEVSIMDQEVEALRAFLGLKKPRNYFFELIDLGDLLSDNIVRFIPVADKKGLRITLHKNGNLLCYLSKIDIDRMITNLLDNAVKYSKRGSYRFIRVTARETIDKSWVELSIESYGTPIKREELASKILFQFGERGEFARHSDRAGTGIGLPDAEETVVAHGGTIEITSYPATPNSETEPPTYKIPYLTIVTIRLKKNKTGEIV